MVRTRTENRDTGRILQDGTERQAAAWDRSGMRGHVGTLPKASRNVTRPPRRNLELLPDESAAGSSGGGQRQHQELTTPRSGLHKSPLPSPESPTHGSNQD